MKVRLDKIEMSMIKWVCTFMVKRGKYGAQEIFGIRTSQLGDLRSVDLRWFGHAERKDDADWVNRCMMLDTDRTRQIRYLRKTWWDSVKDDMKSFDLSPKDVRIKNKWRMSIKGASS